MARLALFILLGILAFDCLLEVGFIGSTVGYLHKDKIHEFVGPDGSILHTLTKPLHLHLNEGHTSNGAAGTALILVGLLGIGLLSLENRLQKQYPRPFKTLSRAWAILSILSLLLTFSALVYTFTIINHSKGQRINETDQSLVNISAYPLDSWTPQTWFSAVLKLEITSKSDRNDLKHQLKLADGWKWNLIPLFLLQLAVTPLILLEVVVARKAKNVS